jgi:Kdo2-lipid IVA lauroyltransferase/acyltransferase
MPEDAIKHPYAPRYWPTWLGLGGMRLISRLPYRIQMGLGWLLGRLMYLFPRRRFIACVNIELAFPEKTAGERKELLKKHFVSVGRGMFETASCWFATDRLIERHVEIRGLEYLQSAIDTGRGVLMFGSHFTSIEFAGRGLGRIRPFYTTYKPSRNPLFEEIMNSRRVQSYGGAIPVINMRGIVKALKQKGMIWYAADQNYGLKNSVFAPFFGIPTATTTGTARIARMSDAIVIPCFTVRKPDASGCLLEFLPALEDFPGDDDFENTARLNKLIEDYVRLYPDQYLWIHRRFKDHPEGGKNRYERYVEESQRH